MPQVVIAGGGSVGLAGALFLAHHGVDVLVVERQDGPAIHPRATGIGPRTVEFFREVGIEAAVNAAAIDFAGRRRFGKVRATTLAAAKLTTALPGEQPIPFADVSPARLRGTCSQDRLDTVLLAEATRRGATVRYSTALLAVDQDDTGVSATLDNGQTIRADYLIAADGGRSEVREKLGIGVSGPGALGEPVINILFRADLSAYTRGGTFANCAIENPDVRGLLVTVDGAKNWILHVNGEPAGFPGRRCAELVRAAVGDPELDVEIRSVLPWRMRGQVADRFAAGRVFLVGDAAHVVPPIGAFGLNTGVADAHNLAWKLALVLRDEAGPSLLDTYAAERRPVAQLVLDQAMRRLEDPRLHWGTGPEADAAREAAGVITAPDVHLGYRYQSTAIVDTGTRLPHEWLDEQTSTLDLVRSRFTVLTDSPDWTTAARKTSQELGIDITAHVIKTKRTILVRPDGFIAWTAGEPGELTEIMRGILGRTI